MIYSAASVAKRLAISYNWDYDAAYAAAWAWLHDDAQTPVSPHRVASLVARAKDVTITPKQERLIMASYHRSRFGTKATS